MDWGSALVSKILQTRDIRTPLAEGITPEDLPEPSNEHLAYLIEYARRTGNKVPTSGTLQRRFRSFQLLPKLEEDWEEIFQELKDSQRYDVLTDIGATYAKAMKDNNLDVAEEAIREGSIRLAQQQGTGIVNLADRAPRFIDTLMARKHMGTVTGVPTGFEWFDRITMGWQKRVFAALGGERESAKTWVLIKMFRAAAAAGFLPLFVSIELSEDEVEERLIALEAKIPYNDVITGNVQSHLLPRLQDALKEISSGLPLPVVTPFNTRRPGVSWVYGLWQKFRPDIIFIDGHYDLYDDQKGRGHEKYYNLTRDTKALCNATNCPVICTTQMVNLERATHSPKKKKERGGTIDDFAFGNTYTQDTDINLILHRSGEMKENHTQLWKIGKLRRGFYAQGQRPSDRLCSCNFLTMSLGEPVDEDESQSGRPPMNQKLTEFQEKHAPQLPGVQY